MGMASLELKGAVRADGRRCPAPPATSQGNSPPIVTILTDYPASWGESIFIVVLATMAKSNINAFA
jgi:hypothetical protein